jgi:glutamyl-tRNA synthetase
MLAFLGWNPGTHQELFSLAELEEAFSLERVGKAGAKFDAEKTKWFQQQHLKNTSNECLAEIISQNSTEKYDLNTLTAICGLMKERATFPDDILKEGAYLLARPTEFDAQTVSKKWNENAPALMREWTSILESISTFDAQTIEATFKAFLTEKNLGIGAVLPLFRLLLTGVGMGPSMFDIATFLGKEEVIERMKVGVEKLG